MSSSASPRTPCSKVRKSKGNNLSLFSRPSPSTSPGRFSPSSNLSDTLSDTHTPSPPLTEKKRRTKEADESSFSRVSKAKALRLSVAKCTPVANRSRSRPGTLDLELDLQLQRDDHLSPMKLFVEESELKKISQNEMSYFSRDEKADRLENQFLDFQSHCPDDIKFPCFRSALDRGEVELELLGNGHFGTVHCARHPLSGLAVAVKDQTFGPFQTSAARQLLASLNLLKRVSTFTEWPASIARHYYAWVTRSQDRSTTVHLQMEICNQGTLTEFANRHPKRLDWIAKTVIEHIGSALTTLRQIGVSHLDVKPDNIGVHVDEMGNVQFKLMDFGCAYDHFSSTNAAMLEGDGRFLAPECLRGSAHITSDVFSLGQTIHYLLFGFPAKVVTDFDSESWHAQSSKHSNPLIDSFLEKSLSSDPQIRVTAGEQ